MPKWKVTYKNAHNHIGDETVEADTMKDVQDHWVDFYRGPTLVMRYPQDRVFQVELLEGEVAPPPGPNVG